MTTQPQATDPKQAASIDVWIARTFKIFGLGGVGLSIVLFPLGKFDPIFFGGCLTAASGGYLGDALHALKPGKG